MSDPLVTNDPDLQRYTISVDGQIAGFAQYTVNDDAIVFTHTEIDPAFARRGLGALLVRHALDDVRATGPHVVDPQCPFVRDFLDRHHEYDDLRRS